MKTTNVVLAWTGGVLVCVGLAVAIEKTTPVPAPPKQPAPAKQQPTQQVELGMTMSEVRKIMGAPIQILDADTNGDYWGSITWVYPQSYNVHFSRSTHRVEELPRR